MHPSHHGPRASSYPVPTTLNTHSPEKNRLANQHIIEVEKKLQEQVMKTIEETFGKES